jgi:hypothetical protein
MDTLDTSSITSGGNIGAAGWFRDGGVPGHDLSSFIEMAIRSASDTPLMFNPPLRAPSLSM